MTIITHPGTAHADEFLACALLVSKFPKAVVERRTPTEEEIFGIPWVVDIGGIYDPARRAFDHHHDPNLPSSFALVARELGVDLEGEPWVAWYDLKDRVGPVRAQQMLGIEGDTRPMMSPIEGAIISLFSRAERIEPGYWLHDVLSQIGEELIMRAARREDELERLRKASRIEQVGSLRVLVCEASTTPESAWALARLRQEMGGADVSISTIGFGRNVGMRAIFRWPDVQLDLTKVEIDAAFKHNAGFLVQTPASVEECLTALEVLAASTVD